MIPVRCSLHALIAAKLAIAIPRFLVGVGQIVTVLTLGVLQAVAGAAHTTATASCSVARRK
jgi:hypothetical protein